MKKLGAASLALFLSLLAGCGGGSATTVTNPPPPTYPNVSGNWSLSAASQMTSATLFLGGNLTSSGKTVTGTLYAVNSSCYSALQAIPFTGTVSSAGVLSVTSSAVNSQVITASGKVSGSNLTGGTYSVAGGCAAGDKGTVTGYIAPSFTNTYAGTFVSASSTVVNVSITTTQTGPDASGLYGVTGTATFTGSPCFTSGTITTSEVAGGLLGVIITTNNNASVEFVGMDTDSTGKTITGDYEVTSGTCAGDSGTGTVSHS